MITMKFGGTSVGDIQRLQDVVTIVRSHLSMQPAIVASAMGGITDTLLDTAQLAVEREADKVHINFETLKQRHLDVADSLIADPERKKQLIESQSEIFNRLANLLRGVGLLKELSVRSLDAIASCGELLSCQQIASILNDKGIPADRASRIAALPT